MGREGAEREETLFGCFSSLALPVESYIQHLLIYINECCQHWLLRYMRCAGLQVFLSLSLSLSLCLCLCLSLSLSLSLCLSLRAIPLGITRSYC